jgi:2-methylcitrate dehydratase
MSAETTVVQELARFVQRAEFDWLSKDSVEQLKLRVLDSIGCALGALRSRVLEQLLTQVIDFGGNPLVSLIGGGKTAPDRAALYNGTLVRYLDFNDSYLAANETCHPSDNLAPVLAAAEYATASGRDFLTALAVAYQVQCRLSDEAPVRAKGFDHTTQGSYAVACGVAKALGLDAGRAANAIAISGTAFNALRVTRTGRLSNWKGLAYPNTAFCATHATFLAMRGITGPLEVFEGNKGFMESIAGTFEIDWSKEDLERVKRTILKRYNAEIHSQSTLEGVLELRTEHAIDPEEIEAIEIDVFDVAFNIIGGGEEGDKSIVHTKEEADHSLPYMVAVATLDGEVMPPQYRSDRVEAEDVQRLLARVKVREDEELSGRFPAEMPARIRIRLRHGESFETEKPDYEGFHTRPMNRDTVESKFRRLSEELTPPALGDDIVRCVMELESLTVTDLTRLLASVAW